MDELIQFNKERWEELAKANVIFSRPALDLDETSAREMLDPHGVMFGASGIVRDLAGKDVLCLAGGGGQQSAAFALLGAQVTVFDLCETQLQRDRQTAEHYGFTIKTVQGDMRDLSCFEHDSFNVVWHPPSINFVPDPRPVFDEVARVIRSGGLYRADCNNPFVVGMDERDWNGKGYSLNRPYVDGAEVITGDPCWEVWDERGNCERIPGPREFRHILSTLLNGLAQRAFVIQGLWEECWDVSENLTPNLVRGTTASLWRRRCFQFGAVIVRSVNGCD